MLTLRWFDAHDVELGVTAEWVLPGTAGSRTIPLASRPAAGRDGLGRIDDTGGARCDFDEAALYASP